MDAGTVTIIAMTTASVGSAVAQKIMVGMGKSDEAQYLDLAIKASLATAALVFFVKFIKALAALG